MALSSSDYWAFILTISDFWDPPSRPSYYKIIFEPKARVRGANNNLTFKTDIIDEFNIQISNKTGFQLQVQFLFEPRCEKNGLRGFRPGPTQTQKMARGLKFRI